MLIQLKKNLSNIPGWATKRKIVVFESDDWGSIRMSSTQSREYLLKKGVNLYQGAGARYNRYDTLASKEDLEALFFTLSSVKDKNNQSAKLTAVSLVANPDFDKIKANGFTKYVYEPLPTTLQKYNRADAFALWKQGFDYNIFVPEFHGREHLNISAWLRSLQSEDKEVLLAFDHGIWGYSRKKGKGFQAAFDLEFIEDLETQKNVIEDGLSLFERLHRRKARFFVPPNGPLNNELEKVAAESGIEYMSTPKIQLEPLGGGNSKKHFRYLGKKNKHRQIYITRNSFFEPSDSPRNEVDACLAEIALAFKWGKPAVISSHRVNYIGGLDQSNRDRSLKKLSELLKQIVSKWVDVEFMTSVELGDLIGDVRKV
jgi:hypothetical protein